jgi:flavin reductase (DIM6/NTAB) family NADH-FMN oxidoreductase RutF
VRLTPTPTDPAELRRAYGCFPSGVTALCALDADGRPTGMAASSFTSVSLDPPLVSVCVQDGSTTWPALRQLPRLGVSVMAEGQDAVTRALASRTGDRFAEAEWSATGDGAVLIHGATAWLDCAVEDEIRAGDHTIVLLRVQALRADTDRSPLVFHGSRFRHLAAVS